MYVVWIVVAIIWLFVSPDPRWSAEKSLQVRDKAKSKLKVQVNHREKRAYLEGKASEGTENFVSPAKTAGNSLSPSFKPGS